MEAAVRQAIEAVHAAPQRLVLAVSGGGSQAAAHLLEVPGASRTVLEVVIPYSDAAMRAFLGGTPDRFCSSTTARAMAMAAFCRARNYGDLATQPLLGVSCTASLATDRPKRGEHRAHLAVQTDQATAVWSVEFKKGRRSRADEESLVSRLLLNVISASCGLGEPLALDLVEGERVLHDRAEASAAWRDLLLGRVEAVRQSGPETETSVARVLFPGAFNPLHVGHRRMAQVAEEILGRAVEFEIAVFNVDKPPLDYVEIHQRAAQFAADQTLWLTRLSSFEEKSRFFPGSTFVVGTDTLIRIADPRYYGHDPAACRQALERLAARGCRFLVFGRRIGDRYPRLSELALPDLLRAICQEVTEGRFREDVRSTDIRRGGG